MVAVPTFDYVWLPESNTCLRWWWENSYVTNCPKVNGGVSTSKLVNFIWFSSIEARRLLEIGVFSQQTADCIKWSQWNWVVSPHLCVRFLFLILYLSRPPLPPPPPPPHTFSFTHNFVTHSLSHTTLSHTIFHTQLCHTPPFTHPTLSHSIFHTHSLCHTLSFTHDFVTHTTFSHTLFHTQLCHTPPFTHPTLSHNSLLHTTLSHTIFHTPNFVTQLSFTHNFVTHTHHLSHTTLSHTTFHTQLCHTPSFTHNFVTHHLLHTTWSDHSLSPTTVTYTSTFTLRGKRGTSGHPPSFCVAGVALAALGWVWWRAWSPLVPRDTAALCVASVALGDSDFRRFTWHAWHLATTTCVLHGRRGTSGTGLGLVARLVAVSHPWRRRALHGRCVALGGIELVVSHGRHGTWRHPPAFCVAGVALLALGSLWWPALRGSFVLRGRGGTYGTGLALVARLVPVGRPGQRGTLRGKRGTWQHLPWLCGRRGTWRHPPSFCVAGVALLALGWVWWRAWSPLDAAALCMAGMALGDIHLRFTWQAWHLATSTFVLRRHFAWQAWRFATTTFVLRGSCGTWRHQLWFCVAGVALGDIDANTQTSTQTSFTHTHTHTSRTHNLEHTYLLNILYSFHTQTWTHTHFHTQRFDTQHTHNSFTQTWTHSSFTRNLSFTSLSRTWTHKLPHTHTQRFQTQTHNKLEHTNFHTQLFHTQPFTHTHNSFTRKLSHTTLLHTAFHTKLFYITLSHTAFHARLFHIQHCHTQHFLVTHSTFTHNSFTHTHTQLYHTHTQFFHTICLPHPIFTPILSLLEEVDMWGYPVL